MKNKKFILTLIINLAIIIGAIWLSAFLAKTIWQSDLPEWFKIWWIAS
jgi:hypothetical protein